MKNDKLKRLAEKLRSSESANVDLELIQNLSKVKGGKRRTGPDQHFVDSCGSFDCPNFLSCGWF